MKLILRKALVAVYKWHLNWYLIKYIWYLSYIITVTLNVKILKKVFVIMTFSYIFHTLKPQIQRIKASPLHYINSTFYQSIMLIHLSFWSFFPYPWPILLFPLLQTTLRCACLPVSSVLFSPLLLSKGGSSTGLLYSAVISSACLY